MEAVASSSKAGDLESSCSDAETRVSSRSAILAVMLIARLFGSKRNEL